jgi:exonuclease III
MGKRKRKMEKKMTRIGTYNLQGKLGNTGQAAILIKDMVTRKIDICVFQETLLAADREFNENEAGMIINLAGPVPKNGRRQYGMAFYISNKWKGKLIGTKSISERISTIKFTLNEQGTNLLTIINVYGPTEIRAQTDANEILKFYEDLKTVYTEEKNRNVMVMIIGDYNTSLVYVV